MVSHLSFVLVCRSRPAYTCAIRNPKPQRKSFGRKIYKALLAISFTLAVNYSFMAVYVNSIIVSDAPDAPYALGLSVVWRGLVFLNILPIVLQEAWQCRTQGFGPYIRDVWNVLDIVMLCLVFASLSVSFLLPKGHRYFYILSGALRHTKRRCRPYEESYSSHTSYSNRKRTYIPPTPPQHKPSPVSCCGSSSCPTFVASATRGRSSLSCPRSSLICDSSSL